MRVKSGDVHILIVEDSPTQAEKLSYVLMQAGYNVSVAPDGRKALEEIREHQPNLVVSDIVMPEMDGFTLCREIKKNLSEIPVILLTALSDPADVLRGLECGADNFVTKPYDENYLLERIYHLLADSELRKESHAQAAGKIFFKGEEYRISSDRQQILELLLSTYETAVMKNRELKEAQDKLEVMNDQLQTEIGERRRREEEVRRLNEDLRRRALQLEEANKDLESFSYSISHDLKAPLRGIAGFSQILVQDHIDELSEEGRALLDKVRVSADRMGMLINDILAFARAGQAEIRPTVIDTNNLVRGIVEELSAGSGGRDVCFKVGALPGAFGDAAIVRQIFYNLLSNAVKFTRGKNYAEIEVGGSKKECETMYYVTDNGAGFDQRYADKLFGVFQRLHSVKEFEGTGIGLAIVKRFINKLGGTVWAEGKVNEGATFYFTLPMSGGGRAG